MIQWAQSLNNDESQKGKDRTVLKLEKLQAWSMLIYYPLEHICVSLFSSFREKDELTKREQRRLPRWKRRFQDQTESDQYHRCVVVSFLGRLRYPVRPPSLFSLSLPH
jgi:hypothetical protein